MGLSTAANVKFHIGTQAEVDLSTPAAAFTDFEADSYTLVGSVEDPGEFGDEVSIVTFTGLDDGRVQKFKGSRDAGDQSVVVGFDAGDAGQQAIRDAADDTSQNDYNIKVELNDAPVGGTPTIIYYRAKVTSYRLQPGVADNVIRANVTLAINSALYQQDAEEGSTT